MLSIKAPAYLSWYPCRGGMTIGRSLVINSKFFGWHLLAQIPRISGLIDSRGRVLQGLGQRLLQSFVSLSGDKFLYLASVHLARSPLRGISQMRDRCGARPSSHGGRSLPHTYRRPIPDCGFRFYLLGRIRGTHSCQSKLVQIDKFLRLLMIPLPVALSALWSHSCQHLLMDLLSIQLAKRWSRWLLGLLIAIELLLSDAEWAGDSRLKPVRPWSSCRHVVNRLLETHRWEVLRYCFATQASAHLMIVLFGFHGWCA